MHKRAGERTLMLIALIAYKLTASHVFLLFGLWAHNECVENLWRHDLGWCARVGFGCCVLFLGQSQFGLNYLMAIERPYRQLQVNKVIAVLALGVCIVDYNLRALACGEVSIKLLMWGNWLMIRTDFMGFAERLMVIELGLLNLIRGNTI